MPLEDLDEKRFTNEEAFMTVGPGFIPPRVPEFRQVLSGIVSGDWPEIPQALPARRGFLTSTRLWKSSRRRLASWSSSLSCMPRLLEVPITVKDLEAAFANGKDGEVYTFDVGPAVIRTIATLKKIDAEREKPLADALHSVRDVAEMAVRDSLEKQWPRDFGSTEGGK